MRHALGISPHTGWAACVVVGGSLSKPEIVVSQVVELLGDAERFCFHMAAEMERAAAEKWIARVRKKALASARRALAPLVAGPVIECAIVAKPGEPGDLDYVLAAHPRLHTAEGCFYRDVFRDACPIPVRLIPPRSLDAGKVGKLAPPPWGRDQKLAALAAWAALKA
ncbi:MAG TPA: hypothetical protein VG389_08645 [Myxococcota bacterium]|nr:hypothetical protein [Myxococcota bacterium]